jgi:hypothetical protein
MQTCQTMAMEEPDAVPLGKYEELEIQLRRVACGKDVQRALSR